MLNSRESFGIEMKERQKSRLHEPQAPQYGGCSGDDKALRHNESQTINACMVDVKLSGDILSWLRSLKMWGFFILCTRHLSTFHKISSSVNGIPSHWCSRGGKKKRMKSENPSSQLRYERIHIIQPHFLCWTLAATREKRRKKKGVAVTVSLYNILLLSQRGFNLVETWSLHSSVLPLALSFTSSLPAYTNTWYEKKRKPSDKLRLGVCLIVIALLSSASRRELNFQIRQIKLRTTRCIFLHWHQCIQAFESLITICLGSCHPDVIKAGLQEQENECKSAKKNLSWKAVAGQMFRWTATPQIECLIVFSACGRLINARLAFLCSGWLWIVPY